MALIASKLQYPIRYWKSTLDYIGATVGLIVMAPVILIAGIFVRIMHGSPVIYRQMRPGVCGKPFRIYKLRTMKYDHDQSGNFLSDSQRLTPLGRFLRKTSIDELPEFINVLKGEMSIVGPRPLLMQYLDRYSVEQARRHEVKPGITGWAQVNGRNALSWEEKFEMDVWYVDNCSLWLDIKIMMMTIIKVIKCEGIGAKGQTNVSEFKPQVSPTDYR